MAKSIVVTPEMLEKAAKNIEALANDYKKEYTELYVNTDAMSSSWQGRDNLAFTEQIGGFKEDFDNMYSELSRYVTFLNQSAKGYRETQQAISEQAKKLTN